MDENVTGTPVLIETSKNSALTVEDGLLKMDGSAGKKKNYFIYLVTEENIKVGDAFIFMGGGEAFVGVKGRDSVIEKRRAGYYRVIGTNRISFIFKSTAMLLGQDWVDRCISLYNSGKVMTRSTCLGAKAYSYCRKCSEMGKRSCRETDCDNIKHIKILYPVGQDVMKILPEF